MRVALARRARQDLADLDWSVAQAVLNALEGLEYETLIGYPLAGRLAGLISIRVGSYRVIYQERDQGRLAHVVAIRHRSVAYGRDPR